MELVWGAPSRIQGMERVGGTWTSGNGRHSRTECWRGDHGLRRYRHRAIDRAEYGERSALSGVTQRAELQSARSRAWDTRVGQDRPERSCTSRSCREVELASRACWSHPTLGYRSERALLAVIQQAYVAWCIHKAGGRGSGQSPGVSTCGLQEPGVAHLSGTGRGGSALRFQGRPLDADEPYP